MVQDLQEMANGLAKNAEELTNNLKEQIGEYKDVDCDSLAKNLQEACKAAKNDGIIPQANIVTMICVLFMTMLFTRALFVRMQK